MKVNTDGILLGAWCPLNQARHILDIGSGTGLISLIMAQRNETGVIKGVEIDKASAMESIQNIANSPWFERVEIIHSSIQDFAASYQNTFDLIVSNPPFFSDSLLNQNQSRTTARHTVQLSHPDLLNSVDRLLSTDGLFSLILPLAEAEKVISLGTDLNLYLIQRCNIRPKVDKKVNRVLLSFSRIKTELQEQELVIYASIGKKYTNEFKALTNTFYLDSAFT